MASNKYTSIADLVKISGMILLGLFLLLAIGPVLWGLLGYNFVYGEGDRVGQVVKLSNKGFIWKTWEGAMGITQSGAYVDYWEFSVDETHPTKEKVLEDLRKAYNTGEIVKIHYIQRYGTVPWHGKTDYFIDYVVFLDEVFGQNAGNTTIP